GRTRNQRHRSKTERGTGCGNPRGPGRNRRFLRARPPGRVRGLDAGGAGGGVNRRQGSNLIFSVFAAAVIGGISLEGGRGRMVGALTGVILLALVQNILILSQIQTFWIDAANGLIILIALALARLIGTERA